MNAEATSTQLTIDHETQQPVEAKTTTALALVTKSIAEINAVETTIAGLEEKYRGVVFQVRTTEGMKEACKARAEIREPRYALQTMQKAAKAPLNELKRSIDEQSEEFIARIAAIEDPIHLQIATEEQRKKEEREAKAEAERKRVAAIRARIDEIRERPVDAAGQSATDIELHIKALTSLEIDDTFAEFKQEAEGAKVTALVRLRSSHAKAVALEEEQARLRAERERLAREREEQEQRRQTEAAEQARVAAIRERIQAIKEYPEGASRQSVGCIEALLLSAKAIVIDDSFAELREEAQTALNDAIDRLGEIHRERKAYEEEQNKLAVERQRQRESEQLGEMRLQEIHGIQQQVIIATCGRLGVREGGTRECIVDTLAETQSWVLTAETFGPLLGMAQRAKDSAVAQIKQLLVQWDERVAREEEQAAEQQRLDAEAAVLEQRLEAQREESARLESERAQLQRDQEELQRVREAGDGGSVEPTASESGDSNTVKTPDLAAESGESSNPGPGLTSPQGRDIDHDALRERIIVDVMAKRLRQVDVHGWTTEHDDLHVDGQIAQAAITYIHAAYQHDLILTDEELLGYWPWTGEPNLKQPRRELLVNAVALLVADIERLDRAQ